MNLGILLGTSSQHLILRCHEWEESKSLPALDETVYDSNKRLVGRIADIFGPVSKPFISIALAKNSGLNLEDFVSKKGESFYNIPNSKKFTPESKNRIRNKLVAKPRLPLRHPKKSPTSPSKKD